MTETEKKEVKPSPGYYTGKIVKYGLVKTKAGKPEPAILFEVTEKDEKHHVFWRGSLNDGPAREITLKALAVCGFTNVRGFAYLAEGIASGLLDVEKEIQLTVIHEENPETHVKYAKVQWVNEAGGGRFKAAMTVSEAANLMFGMGLEADFMRIAQANGYSTTSEPIVKIPEKNTAEANGDIPIPF